MELGNIFASLRHSLLGALLVMVQIAMTLIIVSNTLSLAAGHVKRLFEPSGLVEEQVFFLTNIDVEEDDDVHARLEQDLAIVRATPGVVDATAMNALPFMMEGRRSWISRTPVTPVTIPSRLSTPALYWGDDHTLNVLGLTLVKGRNFRSEEVIKTAAQPLGDMPVILSRALAETVFPGEDAIGKLVYLSEKPSTVIGVVENLSTLGGTPTYGEEERVYQHSLLLPYHRNGRLLVVRTEPDRMDAIMQEVEHQLRAAEPLRIVSDIRPFTELRDDSLRMNRALALMFAGICLLLVLATCFAIIGVTSYWVAQRRRYIGMRRALGASRGHILSYYLVENLLISSPGILSGALGAVTLNMWLMRTYAMPGLEYGYIVGVAMLVLLLCQLSVWWPALRAARIPPALAARSR